MLDLGVDLKAVAGQICLVLVVCAIVGAALAFGFGRKR